MPRSEFEVVLEKSLAYSDAIELGDWQLACLLDLEMHVNMSMGHAANDDAWIDLKGCEFVDDEGRPISWRRFVELNYEFTRREYLQVEGSA